MDLIQPLNDEREELVKKVFGLLSDGTFEPVPLSKVYSRYHADQHPFVLSGEMNPDVIMDNLHKDMNDFVKGDKMTLDEFLAYNRDIGSSVITDKSFNDLLVRVWYYYYIYRDVKDDSNQGLYDRIRYLNGIIISKVEQRCKPTENRKNNIVNICKFYDTGLKNALTKAELNGVCQNYGMIIDDNDLDILYNAHEDPKLKLVPYRDHPNSFIKKLFPEY